MLPVGHVINKMLFEHEAPFLDSCKQGLFEWSDIHMEPCINHFSTLKKLILNI